ncbi:MAG: class I SAM-dependent methyltransferase, partial [Gammaproteobacteria bacterium]|nr:class I SAM-dependent methyltransferase [Gammaproteobacteria bacterium]
LYTDIDLAGWKDDVDVLLAKQYRKMAGGASTVRTAQEIYSIARHFKKPVEHIRVLDFGCGWGHWGMMARAFGLIDYSVEIDEDKARFVKAAGGQTIPLDQVRVMKFDYINAIGVFEHLEEPLETLKVLSSSLGPGGLIRIYVPDGRNVKASLGDEEKWESLAKGPGSLNPILPFGHRNCFTQKALIKMGERAGLTRYRWPMRELLRASVVRLASPRRMAGQFVEPFLLSRSKTTTDLCFIKEG